MPWQDVCPSVCLSVTCRYECKRLYISSNIFTIGSPTILVFPYQTGRQYSDGNPLNGGAECKGVLKNHDFRPISRFISELMQEKAIGTMKSK